MYVRLLLASVVVLSLAKANPVSFIKRCKLGDSQCYKESTIQAIPVFALGIPEYDVKTLDPITFKKLDASSPSLKFEVNDVTFKGLKDCKPKKIAYDESTRKLVVKLLCDIEGDGQYEMKGRLLVLPIEGQGKVHFKLRKMVINVDLETNDKIGKDGKVYWNIKSWKHTYDLKDKADVVFENLFPGNELLGRAARELVASSGTDIVNEVAPPIIRDVIKEIVETINKFFHKVPAEDLIL